MSTLFPYVAQNTQHATSGTRHTAHGMWLAARSSKPASRASQLEARGPRCLACVTQYAARCTWDKKRHAAMGIWHTACSMQHAAPGVRFAASGMQKTARCNCRPQSFATGKDCVRIEASGCDGLFPRCALYRKRGQMQVLSQQLAMCHHHRRLLAHISFELQTSSCCKT